MNIVSIKEIVECNRFLDEKGLGFRVHLRDACGKQSCWLESIQDTNVDDQYQDLIKTLEEFFAKLGFELEYSEDKKNFWIK